MNIDYAAPLKKALAFCIEPKRWLPFFIVDLAFVSAAFALIMANSMDFLYVVAGIQDINLLANVAAFIIELIALFALWLLVGVYLTGAVIHQSHKEKEFRASWKVARGRYFPLLGVGIITGLIAGAVSIIPVVGTVIAIIVGLIFFFAMQGVVVKEHGIMASLRDSWHIFKQQPFKVFLMWIVIVVLSILILLLFAIPLLALIISMIINVSASGQVTTTAIMNLLYTIQNQLPQLVVSVIIALVGLAITRTFSLKAQTEYYLQLRKAK